VKKSPIAGGTACATKAGALFSMVEQAVPPARRVSENFFHGFWRSRLGFARFRAATVRERLPGNMFHERPEEMHADRW
jgi:hypothetical protein